MVALRPSDADRFITKYKTGVAVWLVYGPDTGLVDERISAIAKSSVDDTSDPFQLVPLNGDDIASNPGLLADEWGSIGMFSARRALRLDLGSRDIVRDIQLCLDEPNPNCTLIIRGGALRRDSAVRQLCERHKNAVSIECFADAAQDIERFISTTLADLDIRIDGDALVHLVQSLGADRRISRNELDKLILYVGDRRHIELEDVEAIVTDAAPRIGDAAVAAALQGNLPKATLEAMRSMTDASDFQSLLGAAMRTTLLLHRTSSEIESGAQRSFAIEKAQRFGGYFKGRIPDMLERRDSSTFLAMLDGIQETIARTRREPALAETITLRNLWSVAMKARKR